MEVENGLSFPRYIFNLLHFARASLFLLFFQFCFSFIPTTLVGNNQLRTSDTIAAKQTDPKHDTNLSELGHHMLWRESSPAESYSMQLSSNYNVPPRVAAQSLWNRVRLPAVSYSGQKDLEKQKAHTGVMLLVKNSSIVTTERCSELERHI